MARSLAEAAIVAGGTGLAHFHAHRRVGDPQSFAAAGVTEAGTAVVVVAFLLSLLVGQEGGLEVFQGFRFDLSRFPDRPADEGRAERARRRLNPRLAA